MNCPRCGAGGGIVRLAGSEDGRNDRPVVTCKCGHDFYPDQPAVDVQNEIRAVTAVPQQTPVPFRPLPQNVPFEEVIKRRLAEVQTELPAAIGRVAALKAEEKWLKKTVALSIPKQPKKANGYPGGVVKLIKDIDEA